MRACPLPQSFVRHGISLNQHGRARDSAPITGQFAAASSARTLYSGIRSQLAATVHAFRARHKSVKFFTAFSCRVLTVTKTTPNRRGKIASSRPRKSSRHAAWATRNKNCNLQFTNVTTSPSTKPAGDENPHREKRRRNTLKGMSINRNPRAMRRESLRHARGRQQMGTDMTKR